MIVLTPSPRTKGGYRHPSRLVNQAMEARNVTPLSRNFTLEELIVSSAADAAGISNQPTPQHLANMVQFLVPGLEEIRTLAKAAVVVTSAYRNPQVNKLVGGTPTSAHPQGFAADIRIAAQSSLATARMIFEAMRTGKLAVDQLILESGRRVVHVSFDPRLRGMAGHQPGPAGTPIDWKFFG